MFAYNSSLLTQSGTTITINGNSQNLSTNRSWTIDKNSVNLGAVENTALSSWAGTSNITTLGTVTSGVWSGTAIADNKISSAATWNAKLSSEVDGSITNEIELPSQTGNSGKWLTTNGTATAWGNVYDKGSVSTSGVALQTTYTITHSLGYTPTSIFIQARSNAAAEKSYITNITSTTFQIVFLTVPILGTNNILFDWVSIK